MFFDGGMGWDWMGCCLVYDGNGGYGEGYDMIKLRVVIVVRLWGWMIRRRIGSERRGIQMEGICERAPSRTAVAL
jgi:hypothetical protein